jgi:multiple antibiotic resistance protein
MRLSAFVLLCLGVQILWYGVHELLLGLMVEAMGQAASHPAP